MKIAFDAGHGLNTPGKRSPYSEREWTFNNKVALAFEKEMKKYKVELLRTDDRTGKTDVSLRARTDKANNWNADIYISFHHNALSGKWGNHTGTETYYYQGSKKGQELAKLVQEATVEAYNLRDRGLKTNNLHITRETNMPAVLIEGGFMDSTVDIVKLRDDKVLENAGRYVAQAVAKYAGITGAEVTQEKVISTDHIPYKIKNGDTLYSIAQKHNTTVDAIIAFNEVKHRDQIFIGDTIKLPQSSVSEPQKSKVNLNIDGKWGDATTRELQRALGTPVDGFISNQLRSSVTQALYGSTVKINNSRKGSLVIKALQRKIGSKVVDGLLGQQTIRDLQKYLGTATDGKLSRPSLVVRELQKRLANGTF